MNRLTDNDKNWGPITWAKSNWNRWSAVLSSEAYEGPSAPNTLTIYAFRHIVRINLPSVIKPYVQKVTPTGWDAATIERLGRDYYFNYFDREYGFSLSDGNFFQLYYGISGGMGGLPEGVEEQSWCKHLPWTQWTHVRHQIFTPDGELFATEGKDFLNWYDIKKTCPASYFKFKDYDGEEIIATCIIEEREWHRGEGWFKWLKYFTAPKINRTLDLWFSSEVGPEKGSWKGGTIGHSTEMFKNDTPTTAFIRYCSQDHERKGRKFNLTFLGVCEAPPEKAPAVFDGVTCGGSEKAC